MTENSRDKANPTAESAAEARSEKRGFEELPPAAQRALREAEGRRAEQSRGSGQPVEVGGRGGKDPARYGDWEIDGRAVDF